MIFVFESLPSVCTEQLNLYTISFSARLKLVKRTYIGNRPNGLGKTVYGCATDVVLIDLLETRPHVPLRRVSLLILI